MSVENENVQEVEVEEEEVVEEDDDDDFPVTDDDDDLLHKSSSSNENDNDTYIKWKPAVIDDDLDKCNSSTTKKNNADSKLKTLTDTSKVLNLICHSMNFFNLSFFSYSKDTSLSSSQEKRSSIEWKPVIDNIDKPVGNKSEKIVKTNKLVNFD